MAGAVAAGILACRIWRHLAARLQNPIHHIISLPYQTTRLEAGRYGSQDGRRYSAVLLCDGTGGVASLWLRAFGNRP